MAEDEPATGRGDGSPESHEGVSSPLAPQSGPPPEPWGPPLGSWGPQPAPRGPAPAPWGPPAAPWGPPPAPWGPAPWWPAPVLTPSPELLEPRLRHPHTSRSTFALAGRAAPRLYSAAWILTIVGLAALEI